MDDSAWGVYFGMFRDKYGIEWIVEFEPKSNVQQIEKTEPSLWSIPK